ncbi:glycosyltransferase family 39 protein [Candidatus Gottesmanbacteria bacterium]|nr:glycosyltransferase family 39 protein [Candidatus Gottesmanbacteria bacterium]
MKHVIFLILIVLTFVGLSIGSALKESLTFDEIVHMQEGKNHWMSHSFSIDTNNPPLVRELAAIPLVFGADKLSARLVVVLLGALLIVFVYKREPLAAFILALEPTYLAHSHYVTLDVGAAFFIFLAYLVFLEFTKKQSLRNVIFLGISTGFAFAARIQAIPFLLISMLFINLRALTKLLIVSFIISFLTIWFTYFFTTDVIIKERLDPNRVSARILKSSNNMLLKNLIFVGSYQPIPLGNYLATVKNALVRSTQHIDHRWQDLPFNFFLKTPIPFLLLLGYGLIRKPKKIFVIPAAVIFIVTAFAPQEPWVRYLLPAYPFLAIIAGSAIREVKGNFGKVGMTLIILWYVGGTLAQFPHFISYANELAGPRNRRFEKLIDSNLDWGQGLPDFANYVHQQNPAHVSFSYFGRDNADTYGLVSNKPYGSYKNEEICEFHEIPYRGSGDRIVAISATNWYQCGYYQQPQFQREKIRAVIADSILIF